VKTIVWEEKEKKRRRKTRRRRKRGARGAASQFDDVALAQIWRCAVGVCVLGDNGRGHEEVQLPGDDMMEQNDDIIATFSSFCALATLQLPFWRKRWLQMRRRRRGLEVVHRCAQRRWREMEEVQLRRVSY
jgi:hypothetical protein